jgi:hypothetical protein
MNDLTRNKRLENNQHSIITLKTTLSDVICPSDHRSSVVLVAAKNETLVGGCLVNAPLGIPEEFMTSGSCFS